MAKVGWRDGKLTAKKVIVSGQIPVQYVIPKTVAVATGDILSGHDFNAASTALTNAKLLIQPPYPMNLVLCANVAGTAGHGDVIKVAGEDQFGNYVSENFYIKATAAATTAGAKAFGKIDGISVYSGDTDAQTTVKSTDIGIGHGMLVGLPWPVSSNGDIISYTFDGTHATTAVDGLTINATNNTLTLPASTAAKVMSVIYKSTLQKD